MSQAPTIQETKSKTIPMNVYGILVIGMISISISSILVRLAQGEGLPSLLIAMSRLVLATISLTPVVFVRYWDDIRKLDWRDLGLSIVAGVFLAIHFVSWIYSLEYTTVLVSVVFVTSSPLWVALLEWFVLRQKLPRLVLVGLIIAICGGLLIGFSGGGGAVVEGSNHLLGSGLALLGAIAIAVYLTVGRDIQQSQKLHILPYLWLVYGSAGILTLIIVGMTGTPILGYSSQGYLWLVAMTIFPQLIGHSSLNFATRYLPATIVSMMTQLEPLGSAILAYIIFSELPRPIQILGSGIILVGVMLANLGQRRKAKRKSQSNETS